MIKMNSIKMASSARNLPELHFEVSTELWRLAIEKTLCVFLRETLNVIDCVCHISRYLPQNVKYLDYADDPRICRWVSTNEQCKRCTLMSSTECNVLECGSAFGLTNQRCIYSHVSPSTTISSFSSNRTSVVRLTSGNTLYSAVPR